MPASKNFLLQGLEFEARVKAHFQAQGFRFYAQRFETPFAEVDLVFIKEKRVYFVEVKSCSDVTDFAMRVRAPQQKRLERAVMWWAEKIHMEPCLLYAFVHTGTGRIQVLNPFS